MAARDYYATEASALDPGIRSLEPNDRHDRPTYFADVSTSLRSKSADDDGGRRLSSRERRRQGRDSSRSRSRTPPPRRQAAKEDSSVTSFLGAGGGALIGDLTFPGLGTLGGAILGSFGGYDYSKPKVRIHGRQKRSEYSDLYDDEYRRGLDRRRDTYDMSYDRPKRLASSRPTRTRPPMYVAEQLASSRYPGYVPPTRTASTASPAQQPYSQSPYEPIQSLVVPRPYVPADLTSHVARDTSIFGTPGHDFQSFHPLRGVAVSGDYSASPPEKQRPTAEMQTLVARDNAVVTAQVSKHKMRAAGALGARIHVDATAETPQIFSERLAYAGLTGRSRPGSRLDPFDTWPRLDRRAVRPLIFEAVRWPSEPLGIISITFFLVEAENGGHGFPESRHTVASAARSDTWLHVSRTKGTLLPQTSWSAPLDSVKSFKTGLTAASCFPRSQRVDLAFALLDLSVNVAKSGGMLNARVVEDLYNIVECGRKAMMGDRGDNFVLQAQVKRAAGSTYPNPKRAEIVARRVPLSGSSSCIPAEPLPSKVATSLLSPLKRTTKTQQNVHPSRVSFLLQSCSVALRRVQFLWRRADDGCRMLEWDCSCGRMVHGRYAAREAHGNSRLVRNLPNCRVVPDGRAWTSAVRQTTLQLAAIASTIMGSKQKTDSRAIPVRESSRNGIDAVSEASNTKVLSPGTEPSTSPMSLQSDSGSNSSESSVSRSNSSALSTNSRPSTPASSVSSSSSSYDTPASSPAPAFFELCVSRGPMQISLGEIQLVDSKGQRMVKGDIALITEIRKRYGALRRKGPFGYLYRPADVHWVRFGVQQRGFETGIYQSPRSMPPPIEVKEERYHYYECPLEDMPPIAKETFFHYFWNPHEPDPKRTIFYERMPKKLGSSIFCQYDPDKLQFGWGMHIIEGANRPLIAWMATAVVVTSFVDAVTDDIVLKNQDSGFAIGQWMLAVLATALAALYFHFADAV